MTCLSADRIYLFLENELSPSDTAGIRKHLTACSKCRKAVEERQAFLQAVERLPRWATPPDFSLRVMARIFPEPVPFKGWVQALAAGVSLIALTFLLVFVFSGKNMGHLLLETGHSLLTQVRNASLLLLKLIKLVSVCLNIISQMVGFLGRGVEIWSTIISQEVQILLLTFTLMISVSMFFGVRRLFLSGEHS